MIVTCEKCGSIYNDEHRWTICPHHKLGENPGMTPYEYTEFVRSKQADQKKILERLWFHQDYNRKAMQLDNAARGMAGDVGEVNSCVQKFIEYGKPLDEVNLIEELGDVLWRICQAADAIGKNLQDVIDANVRKLNARYKGRLTEHEALNRNLEEEKAALRGEISNPHTAKIPRPHALVGKIMKPKFQVHPLYYDEPNYRMVLAVHPDGKEGVISPDGVLEMCEVNDNGAKPHLYEPIDSWMIAE